MRLWPRRHGTSLDLLVVGLGNPGREHARNRHNVGWLVVDELARRHGGSWRGKFDGQLAEIRIDGHKVALLKPETYMNESGKSVRAASAFFKTDAGFRARRARRGRPRHGPPAGSARRRARRVTTACARSRSTSARPTSCGCASASAGRAAATNGGSPTTCSQTSSHTTTRNGSSPPRPTPSRRSTPRGSKPRSAPSTANARDNEHARFAVAPRAAQTRTGRRAGPLDPADRPLTGLPLSRDERPPQ